MKITRIHKTDITYPIQYLWFRQYH